MILKHIELYENKGIAKIILKLQNFDYIINEQIIRELEKLCEILSYDDKTKVIVITSEEEHFCIGSNLQNSSYSNMRISNSIAKITKPVIASINGDAIDQGLEIALACDIRIASKNARFGFESLKNDIAPWDGGSQRLPRIIGLGRAMDMILTYNIINSKTAIKYGLITESIELNELNSFVFDIANNIAQLGPIACKYAKEAIISGLDMTIDQVLKLEGDLNFILQTSADRSEGISSFIKKTTPNYYGK